MTRFDGSGGRKVVNREAGFTEASLLGPEVGGAGLALVVVWVMTLPIRLDATVEPG
jgi:hypothetical protein